MDSSTTQGTSSASMIRVATVVFPDALPPHSPMTKASPTGAPVSLYQGGRPAV